MPTRAKLTEAERMELLADAFEDVSKSALAKSAGINRQRVYQMMGDVKEQAERWDDDTERIYTARQRIGKRLGDGC